MKQLILLVFTFSLTFSIEAQDFYPMKDVSTFKEKLQNSATATRTLDCDFVQLKYLSFLSEEIESEGHLSFKKENKIRWEYTSPFSYLIILNDSKLSIVDEEDESSFNLSSNKTFQRINDMIVNSVQGNVLDETIYSFQFQENATAYYVVLTPKEEQMAEYMSAIHLFFNKEDYTVDKVKMVEQSGDYTTIQFKNKMLNSNLDDKLFSVE